MVTQMIMTLNNRQTQYRYKGTLRNNMARGAQDSRVMERPRPSSKLKKGSAAGAVGNGKSDSSNNTTDIKQWNDLFADVSTGTCFA